MSIGTVNERQRAHRATVNSWLAAASQNAADVSSETGTGRVGAFTG
jgi:hypothetical protein